MLVAMAIGVKAQGHYIIPTLGYNFSNVATSNLKIVDESGHVYNFDFSDKTEMKAGFSAGLNYRYEFNKPFLIEVGVYYNNYGFRLSDSKNNSGLYAIRDYKYRVTHFSVPIMFGYKFVIGESKVFSVTPKVGIQLGSYLHNYYRYSFAIGNTGDYFYKDIKYDEKYENGFDVAEMVAVEFAWKVGKVMDIFVNVNNRFSFKNMLNEKNASMYNYTFGAYFGIKLRLD